VKVGIVGCGLVGHKRASVLGPHQLVACADLDLVRAEALAAQHPGARATTDALSIFDDHTVEAVLVCTSHDMLASSALAAVRAGKHVLVEKPGGRTTAEVQPVRDLAARAGLVVKVGFNHRFHPSLQRARKIFDEGGIGDLLYIRGRYGHGGRLGYEKEWRADPRAAGGGELLDQGSHLIDLSRWFAGDIAEVSGHVATYFWPMPVEDNAFVCLKTDGGVVAWLHASWTEWKNTFSFEVFGRTGKLQVDGLGGSYGTERLTYYRMLPEMGPPETTSWEFPGQDLSWRDEFEQFAAAIQGTGGSASGSVDDALSNLRIVQELYRLNHRDYHT
jgi:predicted dehydrogenase